MLASTADPEVEYSSRRPSGQAMTSRSRVSAAIVSTGCPIGQADTVTLTSLLYAIQPLVSNLLIVSLG